MQSLSLLAAFDQQDVELANGLVCGNCEAEPLDSFADNLEDCDSGDLAIGREQRSTTASGVQARIGLDESAPRLDGVAAHDTACDRGLAIVADRDVDREDITSECEFGVRYANRSTGMVPPLNSE